MENIEGMMRKIAGLLATAESFQNDGNAEAAATYREKAESLMRTYRIAEEQLIREQVSSGLPIWRDVVIGPRYGDAWGDMMHSMVGHIIRHCGALYSIEAKTVDGVQSWVAEVVGYDMDIRLIEMMWTSARLAFLARLEPKFDSAASAEENIYRLRASGMDRQTIAKLVFGKEGHAEGIKVGKVYQAECEKRGETAAASGRGFNREAYREAYADEFRQTIRRRLRMAQDAADSAGGSLVLPERESRVREALWARYPYLRPETPQEKADREKREAAREAAMTPAEKADREKRQKAIARRSKWTQADEARWQRIHGPKAEAAREAGASAARSVDLTRQAPSANRTGAGAAGKELGE